MLSVRTTSENLLADLQLKPSGGLVSSEKHIAGQYMNSYFFRLHHTYQHCYALINDIYT